MTNARTKSASLVCASLKLPIRARIWPSWCALLLAEVAEDDPVGGVVGEITDYEDHQNCKDDPERPVVLDETVLLQHLARWTAPIISAT